MDSSDRLVASPEGRRAMEELKKSQFDMGIEEEKKQYDDYIKLIEDEKTEQKSSLYRTNSHIDNQERDAYVSPLLTSPIHRKI